MKYYEYIVHCSKLPSRQTLHSVVSHFFGKDNITKTDFKVDMEGNLIRIITDQKNECNFEITLYNRKGESFICKLIKSNIYELKEYENEENVLISGIIEYGINITGKNGKVCPFYMGKFVNNDLRIKFKKHIEKELGVEIFEMQRSSFKRMPSEILSNHIQFNNILNIDLRVNIKDKTKFNKIKFKSFFQKKSYGFGNLEVYE